MKITAIIKEVEGQLFIEFAGDMKDIVPVDEVFITDGLKVHSEIGTYYQVGNYKLTS